MVSARYYSLCAASGLVWGGIAYFLGGQWFSAIWGGIIASPLIGLMVGLAYRPIYRLPLLARVFLALLMLYLAATLFGLAVGVLDTTNDDIKDRISSAVVIESVLAILWGLTFSGFVLFLWPLAFANHWVLGRTLRKT